MYSVKPPISVPGNSVSNYNQSWVSNYIQSLVSNGSNFSGANIYTHGATVVANAYIGGVYSPTQNRIYFVPYAQASELNWHYVDCNTGTIVAYAHGLGANTPLSAGYGGGAYSPTQNRIYFAPFNQGAPNVGLTPKWHYVDCNTGSIGIYDNPNTAVSNAYLGAIYSPTQNRIYFSPSSQAGSGHTVWHYINCNDGTVGTYANPLNAVAGGAYYGGVYSPTQNRIYFVPSAQATPFSGGSPLTQYWHYIDCNATGSTTTIGTYLNPNNSGNDGYRSGAYSPTQNRIYFCPVTQCDPSRLVWHYIDCNTGALGTYPNPLNAVFNGYVGMVFSPTQNRIYLVPRLQCVVGASTLNWHYIDCNTGNVLTYLNPNNMGTGTYIGGVYSPTQNRVYFVPFASNSTWNYLDMQSNAKTSKVMMANATYNHF